LVAPSFMYPGARRSVHGNYSVHHGADSDAVI
jgi:hypothetical protein